MLRSVFFISIAPGAYEPEKVNLDSSPSYSFGTKNYNVAENKYPAPGAYEPEKVNLEHSPAYSFGIKANMVKSSDTPGTQIWSSYSKWIEIIYLNVM